MRDPATQRTKRMEQLYYSEGYRVDADSTRELNLSTGAYTPEKGIYSLGWDGWEKYPAAEFVKELISIQLSFNKEHENEPFYPYFGPGTERGEFSPNQLKYAWQQIYHRVDGIQILAQALWSAGPFRDVRDMILRHLFEETGHGEMLCDFLVKGYGMRREEVYLAKPDTAVARFLNFHSGLFGTGHFLDYAVSQPFVERMIPKTMRKVADSLRKNYGFKGESLIFFDVHTYIDIYHERIGKYLIAKYATTKELQDSTRQTLVRTLNNHYEMFKLIYQKMPRKNA